MTTDISLSKRIAIRLSPHIVSLVLVLLYSGLLSIAFLDHERYYLAWIGYVPLLFAIEKATLTKTYIIGVIAGVISFASGTYWIYDFVVISKGLDGGASFALALLVWFYCAQQTALILVAYKWLRRHSRLHEFLLFPLIIAATTSAFPMLFAMRLGESQINFYSALQATEFVGVHGLDAIIALANVLIFRSMYNWLHANPNSTINERWPSAIATSILAVWLGYGAFSYAQWEQAQSSWDRLKIGMVQPNEIPWLGERARYPGYSQSYPPEMAMTEQLTELGAQLVIWPEAQSKDYLNNTRIADAYQATVAEQGVSLLFQDTEQHRNLTNGELLKQYNTAVMLNQKGDQTGRYDKLKRIPFGEYLPFVSDDSELKTRAKHFLGEFLNEITKGEGHQLFHHEQVNIIPLICYETTFPSFVGSAVKAADSLLDKRKGTVMIGLSNDGWFGSSHQPYQHIMVSVVRAVENRLPLIHVANNGPSIVVAPSGRVTFTSDFQQAGAYLTEVAHSASAQGSFYSQHPKLFERLLYLLLLLVTLLALFRRLVERANH